MHQGEDLNAPGAVVPIYSNKPREVQTEVSKSKTDPFKTGLPPMGSKFAEDYELMKAAEKQAVKTVQPDSLDALFAGLSVS